MKSSGGIEKVIPTPAVPSALLPWDVKKGKRGRGSFSSEESDDDMRKRGNFCVDTKDLGLIRELSQTQNFE